MTNEQAINILNGDNLNRCAQKEREALEMAISALSQEPCTDAVSREAVDKYIVELLSGYLYEEERERLEKLSVYLWELPPVQPKSETVTEFADRCRECGARYGKLLEQIRAEIDGIEINGQVDDHTMFIRTGGQVKQMALEIIDKYMK